MENEFNEFEEIPQEDYRKIFTKKNIYGLALLTLLGFSIVGLALLDISQEKKIGDVINQNTSPYFIQIYKGFLFGAIASLFICWLLRLPILKERLQYFGGIMKMLKLNWFDIVFISLCAGIGEELFFRGLIQGWLGIWATAFIFILLHGYFSFSNLGTNIYGTVMVIICAGFGYLCTDYGLVASMIAHTVIDVAIFALLKYSIKNNEEL